MLIRPFISVIRLSFLSMLAYRLRYYTGILTYTLFVSVNYFVWKAAFAGKAITGDLHGFNLEQMITYVAIGWIARSFYFSDIDEEIDTLVRSGAITTTLLRPLNFQLMLLAQAVGASLFRLVLFSLPITAALIFLFPIAPPVSAQAALLFTVSTLGSFLILAQLNFIVGLAAFYLQSIDGLIHAKYYLVQLFSGLLLPLVFFPQWLQTILHFLPFQLIASVPLQFYLGKIPPGQIVSLLAEQAFWIFLLALSGHLASKRAFRRLTLQGG